MSAFDDMTPSEAESRSLERLLGCSHNLVLMVALVGCCLRLLATTKRAR